MKIYASKLCVHQKIGAQALRLLTIWARQNHQLLTSSESGWRALVQVMLPLVHVVLKWLEHSGRPAYMGGVSPVLYQLLYRQDLSKYLRLVQISAGAYIFTISWGKTAVYFIIQQISWTIAPFIQISHNASAPKIRTWSQKLSKFSCNTFKPLNGGHPRFWLRTLKIAKFVLGVCVGRGGGGLISTTLLARACNARSSLGLNSCWPHSRLSVECLFPLLPPFSVLRGAVQ